MRNSRVKQTVSALAVLGALLGVSPCFAQTVFSDKDQVALSKGLAHYALGQVYDLLGMTNRAVLEYEESLQYDNSSYLVHLRLGAGYARLNMLAEAIDQLKLVNQTNPEDLQSHYMLALIYSSRREYTKAAEEYELILKSFSAAEPENLQIYSYLGQLYYSQKKYDKAIAQYEKILTFDPTNPDVLYLLGSLYWEVGDRKLAIDLLEKSVVIDPQHDSSLNTLGYFYAENNIRLDEANNLIERALEISPENGGYLDSLGWVYYKKGMYQEALETLIKADQYLKDPVIYDHMGDVYEKLNHLEDAIKYWELSLQLLPKQEAVIKKIDETKKAQQLNAANNTNP